MPQLSYPGCIRRLYESEVNGEAIFSTLLKVAKTQRERYQLATLLQLETETKAWLQPFLFRYGVEFTRPDITPLLERAVVLYNENGWKGLMQGAKQIGTNALADFEAIAAVGPASDASYLKGMVRHEKAILSWVSDELQDAGDASLNSVIAQLRYPISPP